jgi:hypothetical protein
MGYVAESVERWIPQAKIRRDLFGIIDIVGAHPTEGIIGIQCTTYSNISARVNKARENDKLPVWLAAGGKFRIHGWRKVNGRWAVRTVGV